MLIPFLSAFSDANHRQRSIYRRQRGRGGGGSTGGGGNNGQSEPPQGRTVSIPGLPPGSRGSTSYGFGGGRSMSIPSGLPFAGREFGGGTRAQIHGTRTYGSGYPNLPARSVSGRGFPFGFWPLAWGSGAVAGAGGAYIYENEYGLPDNTTRPGGVLVQASIMEQVSSNVTYRFFGDETTARVILGDLASNCSIKPTEIQPFSPGQPLQPEPSEVIQYYRSSSAALTLDDYSNAATFQDDRTLDSPLPAGLNLTFLDCINTTISLSLPIVITESTEGSIPGSSPTGTNSAGLQTTTGPFYLSSSLCLLAVILELFRL